MDIPAIKARAKAATAEHRELEAIPKSVCLGCEGHQRARAILGESK